MNIGRGPFIYVTRHQYVNLCHRQLKATIFTFS